MNYVCVCVCIRECVALFLFELFQICKFEGRSECEGMHSVDGCV